MFFETMSRQFFLAVLADFLPLLIFRSVCGPFEAGVLYVSTLWAHGFIHPMSHLGSHSYFLGLDSSGKKIRDQIGYFLEKIKGRKCVHCWTNAAQYSLNHPSKFYKHVLSQMHSLPDTISIHKLTCLGSEISKSFMVNFRTWW